MVDEKQTVRDVLDKLFEKTHCDGSIDWSLWEINPELQAGKITPTPTGRNAEPPQTLIKGHFRKSLGGS